MVSSRSGKGQCQLAGRLAGAGEAPRRELVVEAIEERLIPLQGGRRKVGLEVGAAPRAGERHHVGAAVAEPCEGELRDRAPNSAAVAPSSASTTGFACRGSASARGSRRRRRCRDVASARMLSGDVVSRPMPSGLEACSSIPSAWHRTSSSSPSWRLASEYSIWSTSSGCTAWAASRVRGPTSDTPMARALPASQSSTSAPIESSSLTWGSTR